MDRSGQPGRDRTGAELKADQSDAGRSGDGECRPRLVADQAGLADAVAALRGVSAYAVDTEFHRERTYYPKLALVQLAWPGSCLLIDPLAVGLTPLAEVLDGPGVAVMHAASQDLEVLQRACGTVPTTLFDTQVAAGFLGFSTPSLASLADRVLDVHLPKASRLTDWLRRPLDAGQLGYAAADVAHLLELADLLREELDSSGRLGWVEAECEELRTRAWGPPAPEDAWRRLKESRALRGRARGVARAVAAWRERQAAATDQPVRFVLSDMAVVGIAHDAPRTMEQLRRVRGVDTRHLRGAQGKEILLAVEEGRSLPDDEVREPRPDDLERRHRPAVALLAAWVSQLARDQRIDAGLLATRSDLVAFVNGDPEARLARGWREELVGRPARRLVEGELALAFDGQGGLSLERRSHDVVAPELPKPSARWAGGDGGSG